MKINILLVLLLCVLSTNAQIINTFAGTGTAATSGDGGPATAAALNWPSGIFSDQSGNIYIGESEGYVIRKVNTSGVISTFAGTGIGGHSGDGGPATAARIGASQAIGIDSLGNIYIGEGDTPRIRKISTSGIITTIAGTGARGFSGDGGPATAATFDQFTSIAVDQHGNVYVGDTYNHRIRKINSSTGIITTIAGNGSSGDSGDGGPSTGATLGLIIGLSTDKIGNLYVRDDSAFRIRKINSSGIISAVTRAGVGSITGDGGPATAATIGANGGGMIVDAGGNLYIVENNGHSVRKINATDGKINTVIGTGTSGFSGDGGPASSATFYGPWSIAIAPNGNIYITDLGNMRVRYIRSTVGVTDIIEKTAQITLSPNPATAGAFTLNINTGIPETAQITITNVTGSTVSALPGETNKVMDIQLDVPKGLYFVTVTTSHGVWVEKVVVD